MRGEFMWIGWASGSKLLQGTSVMMSVFIFNGTSGRGKFVRELYRMDMEFLASVSDLCESISNLLLKGMGSVNSPAHTQEDWVPPSG
eukprot:814174-Pelagomonas_calceolata.AAC.1